MRLYRQAQIVLTPAVADLRPYVAELLREGYAKTLLFANSRRACEELHASLSGIGTAECLVHYSSLSADQRRHTETAFQRSRTALCIATSTLELGMDVGSVDAVVLWGPPPGVASYLQRAGRGGP